MKTERELARSLRALVDSQDLPPSPWRTGTLSLCRTVPAEPGSPWPEDSRIAPVPEVIGLVAGLTLASTLALSQAADGGRLRDAAAGRFFAQEQVQTGLRQAIENLAGSPPLHESDGEVHIPESNTGPQPAGGGSASA